MTKQELLTLDVLALQKLIKDKTKEKDKLEADIRRLHGLRHEAQLELGKPMPELQSALQLLRIESESLAVQIAARKKELVSLGLLHTTTHEHHATQVALKKTELSVAEQALEKIQAEMLAVEKQLQVKREEVVSLTKQIQTLQFELSNYQKTILLISNQEKELIVSLRQKVALEKKLDARIRELKRTHHAVVGDILTERNKRLWKRHKQRTGMNQALDTQIERKRKKL